MSSGRPSVALVRDRSRLVDSATRCSVIFFPYCTRKCEMSRKTSFAKLSTEQVNPVAFCGVGKRRKNLLFPQYRAWPFRDRWKFCKEIIVQNWTVWMLMSSAALCLKSADSSECDRARAQSYSSVFFSAPTNWTEFMPRGQLRKSAMWNDSSGWKCPREF